MDGFEKDGTLPNSIPAATPQSGHHRRAPVVRVVAEDLAALEPGPGPDGPSHSPVYSLAVDSAGRTVAAVLRSIACGYLQGTPTGFGSMPPRDWSGPEPLHVDGYHHYPAGTPREGHPVEIRCFGSRLLRQLARLGAEPWEGRGESWGDLAKRAEECFHHYFWVENAAGIPDVLPASRGTPARIHSPGNALRVIAFGWWHWDWTAIRNSSNAPRRMLTAAAQHLVVPGAAFPGSAAGGPVPPGVFQPRRPAQ